ncbi:uncharacterized protein ASPGLDRAFT_53340 [Aspergillus glaucus CBS 516.65]|uniref:DUF3074 domain-containing protein n=1 Tax=Aspergillus glaucus CBS 516.65 TaxID=1160497 RepID=A0A1L9V476_ASPGL|nr:hypothetical protein ASPGLDRAFT_53340 [Aspergillus glaucus CBS 516.65]OJJ78745.1 hypothetical protein ASPGLDRAFT_53340 [Aspergillus glaucus CBS 516.65]
MSLHEALQALGPTTWDEIPKSQPDLRAYLSTLAQQASTIIASVPEPAPSSSHDDDDHHHHHKKEQQNKHGHAYTVTPSSTRLGTTNPEILSLQKQWGKPLKPGNSRDNPQEIPLFKLQAGDGKATWFGRRSVHEGMPFGRWRGKLSSELEETLRLNEGRVEKGLAPDKVVRGLGAARRVESVDVREEGEGEGGKVIGGVKVYDICAHFPKPTTARDFVQVSVSWEEGVDTLENGDGGTRRCRSWLSISKPCTHPELPPQDGYIRGQYDSLEFIREVPPVSSDDGKSVTASDPNLAQHEGISESSRDSKKGRKREKTDTAAEEKQSEAADSIVEDNEANPYPVEWIMVTRSDPGGSIPRWVIEKGTPKSIWGDTVKFIDWASRDDEKDDSKPSSLHSGAKGSNVNRILSNEDEDENGEDEIHEQEQRNGLIANFAYLLNAGIERYAPQAILDYVPYQRRSSLSSDSGSEEFDDALSTASTRSSLKRRSSSKTRRETESQKEGSDISHTNIAPVDLMQMDKKTGKLNSHERHLAKLAQRKRDVQAKLEAVRTEIEALRLDANANANASVDEKEKETDKEKEKREKRERKEKEKQEKQEREREKKEEKEREKKEKQEKRKSRKAGEEPPAPEVQTQPQPDGTTAPDSDSKSTTTNNNQPPSEDLPRPSEKQERPKHARTVSTASHRSAAQIHKAASGLFAQESKLLKQLGKIEQDQLKEASKIEARQKKQVEKEEKSRSRMEMDGIKKEVDELKKEVEKLRNERQQWQDLVASLQGENQRLGGQGQVES